MSSFDRNDLPFVLVLHVFILKALEKKSALQKLVTVQDQYQKMLKDCAAFLDTAQDKLHLESITARDLNHLKQQLAAHKVCL